MLNNVMLSTFFDVVNNTEQCRWATGSPGVRQVSLVIVYVLLKI